MAGLTVDIVGVGDADMDEVCDACGVYVHEVGGGMVE